MSLESLNLPVFPHPCFNSGDFHCRNVDQGFNNNSLGEKCLAGWTSNNDLALLYNIKNASNFYSGRWNTNSNPDLAFASVGPNSRLPDRQVFKKFPRL